MFALFFMTTTGLAERHEFSRPLMGMAFRIIVHSEDEAKAKRAAKAAFDRVAVLNQIMSDYEPESELNKLSNLAGSGKVAKISDELCRVLDCAQALAVETGGAFDVTLGPVIDAWGFGKERHRHAPTAAQLTAARALTGHEHLAVQEHPAAIKKALPSLALNLSAIAKGHGVDRVAMLLEARGVDDYLVEIGGEIRVAGEKKPGVQWKVANGF